MLTKSFARAYSSRASAHLRARPHSKITLSEQPAATRWLNTSPKLGVDIDSASTAASGGTIADIFASLSGKSLQDALPPRFANLKRQIISSHPNFQQHLEKSWSELLPRLAVEVETIARGQQSVIPEVHWPGEEVARAGLAGWMSSRTQEEVRKRGVVIVRDVVPSAMALRWKEEIREYASRNGAKGFPAEDPQVFELYWSRAQLAARSHPALLTASRSILEMWRRPRTMEKSDEAPKAGTLTVEQMADMSTPLTYADRLRIRSPGDATFALGPHIDGGGIERWEDPTFLSLWQDILSPSALGWQHFNNWSLGTHGERMTARTGMYNGPGQCTIFRPLQGWLSMSRTGPGEGTLRVLPNLREVTAYIIMRPFFQARSSVREGRWGQEEEQAEAMDGYLAPSNWVFDGSSSRFPGCLVGQNLELSPATHPHLRLEETMISLPQVNPGDLVLWHCDAVHSVEAAHTGQSDSSVMYIPAVPLTANNWRYVLQQAKAFRQGRPPSDFPSGDGEVGFEGRGKEDDVHGEAARTAMGLGPIRGAPVDDAVQKLRAYCNATLAAEGK
ncbi:DUF1479-domain-containing protein [Microstroma glucosiphilum]|uniref:DUF1479-domain-containing protein n=1 Tax=Pseudomicrostroma glucosiphilum TaxID=1684307 RepID=A0A316TZB3_9BASI|nr:DUF1479-domain-containing protein [Pseudomicrostroma glucosiphilum]PWN18008.1 DUF1479-domain-containing protein [Pseudomicrostroma glucosiphilum]